LNQKIQKCAQSLSIGYADIGTTLLMDTGKIDEKSFSDELYPNAVGYELLGKALVDVLK
jgi:lysophospholipase L1-like esterase